MTPEYRIKNYITQAPSNWRQRKNEPNTWRQTSFYVGSIGRWRDVKSGNVTQVR